MAAIRVFRRVDAPCACDGGRAVAPGPAEGTSGAGCRWSQAPEVDGACDACSCEVSPAKNCDALIALASPARNPPGTIALPSSAEFSLSCEKALFVLNLRLLASYRFRPDLRLFLRLRLRLRLCLRPRLRLHLRSRPPSQQLPCAYFRRLSLHFLCTRRSPRLRSNRRLHAHPLLQRLRAACPLHLRLRLALCANRP